MYLMRQTEPSLLGTNTDNVIHVMAVSGLDAGKHVSCSSTTQIQTEYLGVCGDLTLAGCWVPTKTAVTLLLSWAGERKY